MKRTASVSKTDVAAAIPPTRKRFEIKPCIDEQALLHANYGRKSIVLRFSRVEGAYAIRMSLKKHLIDLRDVCDHLFGPKIGVDVPATVLTKLATKAGVLEEANDRIGQAS